MSLTFRTCAALSLAIIISAAPTHTSAAQSLSSEIGIVIMHGKGGSPNKYVLNLASSLEANGYLVANLEMPWSERREYDVNVDAAEQEVQSALDSLRARGAKKLFVAGHSQGALFALYFGGKQLVDGIIAIAPGGSVNSTVFREALGESMNRARKRIAEGKGNEKTSLMDYEGSKGAYPITVAPNDYVTWFDPEGAMSLPKALKAVNPQVPVLYIAPTRDYKILLKTKQQMFSLLPHNPLTKLYEPESSHLDAPFTSRGEITRWTKEAETEIK